MGWPESIVGRKHTDDLSRSGDHAEYVVGEQPPRGHSDAVAQDGITSGIEDVCHGSSCVGPLEKTMIETEHQQLVHLFDVSCWQCKGQFILFMCLAIGLGFIFGMLIYR